MEPRKYLSDAVAAPPEAPAVPSVGYPTDGADIGGLAATTPGAYWFYQIGEEIRNVILSAGLTPDISALNQLDQAIIAKIAAAISSDNDFLHIQDQKPAGTHGGTYTGGIWETRVLNTVVKNTISGASLSSNQITLPAGDYYIDASSVGFGIAKHKSVIYDVTNGENLIIGTSEMSSSTTSSTSSSRMAQRLTLAEQVDIEIRTFGELTRSSDGLGTSSASGLIEIYSDIKIWRLS